jgi:hypothetical protein
MTSQVVVSVTTKDVQVPAGTVQGKFVFSVTGQPDQTVDAQTATFTGLADGDYVASVQALDSNGGRIGNQASVSFTVTAPASVTLQGADVVSVTVTPE